ncbi:MAG: TIGR03663 family protein [Verrucomicrobia bacterium]|nr:TIGR03663 family protein [Verrucomicrobiota bacterium]
MSRGLTLGLILAAAGALALRGPQLDLRPMHNDEAVNAIKIRELWEQGRYRYDPDEFHGPSLHYATLPLIWLSGARDFEEVTEKPLRTGPVVFGIALVLLVVLLADGLGRPATLWAAALTAVSPAMVFYSRYFIHEMLLVCFTLLFLGAVWRYYRRPHWAWAAWAGAGLGLMYATKETFVLAVITMGFALGLSLARDRWALRQTAGWAEWFARWNWIHLAIGLSVGVAISSLLFTSFLTNAQGPLDSIRTYLPWGHRAQGHSSHTHPWHFYLERLACFQQERGPIWSEGFILVLAGVGCYAGFRRAGGGGFCAGLVRFLAFYTILLTAAYSAIPYKTPWCLLGFLHGMILLAGVGAAFLLQPSHSLSRRAVTWVVLLAAGAHLTWETWRANFGVDRQERLYAADRRNPYVYAQTVPDLLELVEKIKGLAAASPEGKQLKVHVVASEGDDWPLPWYLRGLSNVWWLDEAPADPYARVVIGASTMGLVLDEKSNRAWTNVGLFTLRPRVYLDLFVESRLWRAYVESKARERDNSVQPRMDTNQH